MFSKKFITASREYSTLTDMVPAPYLRRVFTPGDVSEASVTVCGLGFYELYLNGERITKGRLAPYISNPDDILYYDRYDLTGLLRPGENVLGLHLGNGMLNCPGGQIWDFEKAAYRSAPKAALSFEAVRPDGSGFSFEADERFVCAPSPVYYDDLRAGECYDARNELPGWNCPGFDDSGWTPALPAETPRGIARLCEAEPIVVTRELPPLEIRRARIGKQPVIRSEVDIPVPMPGTEGETEGWLYDFGVNAAGVCRLKVNGKPGQKIVLQFGEALDENGDLDLRGMSFLPAARNHRDIYICRGGEEEWTPAFTYHGFRYCIVLGLEEEQAVPELLTYLVMNSDISSAGGFSCSDDVLDRLQEATRVADLANFYYFPTDCPHREKNGWTADAALSCEQLLLNFTPERSYAEWLRNIRRAQREDGALPGIIPTGGWGFDWGNGPAWDCILVYLPYFVWKYRGDIDIIRENAPMILRYLHYISTRRDEDGLVAIGLGDWCTVDRDSGDYLSPLKFTDTVLCMDICHKAAICFGAAGMAPQKAFAEALYDEFRAAARLRLIDPCTMTALGNCQTSQAMAIFYDVFDPAEKPEAFRVLLSLINEDRGLMNVGVLGARVLFRVLSDFGRTDLAYAMVTDERFPSYANMIARGNTALIENFDPAGMPPSSLNHHFWGDISGWMISYLAGICVNPCDTSPSDIRIRPRFIDPLDHVSGWHDLPAGKLEVSWKREGEDILLTVTVPEGCRGDIILERGWQFENGTAAKPAVSGLFRILPRYRKNHSQHSRNLG
ncbi:MAG: family 78 glycoside hydrolase catalytic domain [Oscillospiraceae bacterium]|nr:family 78 glycoside hydrolase catalytic domain [Oscillospiraceae bacterium]